ncbi:hypothetical protein XELAEV_18025857mg [Xenopus laevis]|uniref:Secreted protein n=1 Tax=Xenopus laevis TaxID=8355 RepID=A0A974D0C8_XENLA|nr:hypothetical protein XELAEV_18025857mg [Xenopus laevis]
MLLPVLFTACLLLSPARKKLPGHSLTPCRCAGTMLGKMGSAQNSGNNNYCSVGPHGMNRLAEYKVRKVPLYNKLFFLSTVWGSTSKQQILQGNVAPICFFDFFFPNH